MIMMKHIKLIVLLVSALFVGNMPAVAQKKAMRPDRKEWFAKMRGVKHDFMVRELQLTDAQKKDFFEVYDKCEDARHKLEHEVRQREKAIEQKGDAATDEELDALINDQFMMAERMSKIDKESLPQLRKVLTRRQLVRLKHAERKFNRKLMEKHNEACPPPPAKSSK